MVANNTGTNTSEASSSQSFKLLCCWTLVSIKRHMAQRTPPHYSLLTHIESAGITVCAASAHTLLRHRSLFKKKGSHVIHH